jgi:hypothetical protein
VLDRFSTAPLDPAEVMFSAAEEVPMSAPRHRGRALAAALATAALLAPTAAAAPAPEAGGNREPAPTKHAPIVSQTIDTGFDVGSGAVGAGGATAGLLLAAGAASALWHRRHRHVPSTSSPRR